MRPRNDERTTHHAVMVDEQSRLEGFPAVVAFQAQLVIQLRRVQSLSQFVFPPFGREGFAWCGAEWTARGRGRTVPPGPMTFSAKYTACPQVGHLFERA